jgi:hypothetical protein
MNEPRPDHILQVGLGFWASKTLLSAVEMELFTELAERVARQRIRPGTDKNLHLAKGLRG